MGIRYLNPIQLSGKTIPPMNAPPQSLHDFLHHNWYIYHYLTRQQQAVVAKFTTTFCANTQFVISADAEDLQRLQWLVGANAALVGGAQKTSCFASVRWVYLLGHEAMDPDISGDALGISTVRMNAEDLVNESIHRHSGQQIAIHEFAHILDMMFGISDSTPGLREGLELHLQNRREHKADIVHDDVFNTIIQEDSNAEFFSYMSEFFFTDPHALMDFYPPLYADMVSLYGLDLIKQMPRLQKITAFDH